MARTGWSSNGRSGATPSRRRSASPPERPRADRRNHRGATDRRRRRCRAPRPGSPARRARPAARRLIATCRQAGSSTGSSVTWANRARCQGGSWWWRSAGPAPQHGGHDPRGGQVHGDGEEVLDDDEVGVDQRLRDLDGVGRHRRLELQPARRDDPTGPSPATVTVRKPELLGACAARSQRRPTPRRCPPTGRRGTPLSAPGISPTPRSPSPPPATAWRPPRHR